jgi:hypothetical protein
LSLEIGGFALGEGARWFQHADRGNGVATACSDVDGWSSAWLD